MKTTTYLVNKRQSDGTVRLSVADHAEWLAVVKANRELPAEQRRYFIVDYIKDGTDLDCMVTERIACSICPNHRRISNPPTTTIR